MSTREKYRQFIKEISENIIKAQKPIRVLDSIKWSDAMIEHIKDKNLKKLSDLSDYYNKDRVLSYDPNKKINEFVRIQEKIKKNLGDDDQLGKILFRNAKEYELVVKMLQSRGTPGFYYYSKILYGSAQNTFADGETNYIQLGESLESILKNIDVQKESNFKLNKSLTAKQVVNRLNKSLSVYFHQHRVVAKIDDGISSDAAAGSKSIKINKNILFDERELKMLEVHEGWVHVGTTLNGQAQNLATFLSKGPPCTTRVQEGLAALMEVFNFVSYPGRLKKISNRIIAINMAEEGADVIEVFEFFLNKGLSKDEAAHASHRVFRGGTATGGAPFTKDLAYGVGLISVYNFIRSVTKWGKPHLLPFLFVGKVTLEDIPILYEYYEEKIIDHPLYVPPQFSDLNGLVAWMGLSNFLNTMNLDKISKKILKRIA